jgi:hypothetical protein
MFVLISTHRLKPGAIAAERARVPGLVEFVESQEPRAIAFTEYADDEAGEVTVVQIHPGQEVIANLRASAGDRFRLTIKPDLLGGFMRTA